MKYYAYKASFSGLSAKSRSPSNDAVCAMGFLVSGHSVFFSSSKVSSLAADVACASSGLFSFLMLPKRSNQRSNKALG